MHQIRFYCTFWFPNLIEFISGYRSLRQSRKKMRKERLETDSERSSDSDVEGIPYYRRKRSFADRFLDDECEVGEEDGGEIAEPCPPIPYRFPTRAPAVPVGHIQNHEEIMEEVQGTVRGILADARDALSDSDSTNTLSSDLATTDSLHDWIDDRCDSALTIESSDDLPSE